MATLYEWFDAGLELIECLWLLNVFIIFITTATIEVLFYFNVAGVAAMAIRSMIMMAGIGNAKKGGGDSGEDVKLLAEV